MKFETKESSPCVIALTVQLDAEEAEREYQKVLNKFTKEGTIAGFRKGKAPRQMIEKSYAREIQQDCEQECYRLYYPTAVKEAKLDIVYVEGISELEFSRESGFKATILIEVRPVFDLPKYRGCAIKKGDTTITDEQVTDRMEAFRKAFAKYETCKAEEGFAVTEGDFVQFDYAGTLDDADHTPLTQVVPDQQQVSGATDFWTQVEDGRFIKELLDALKGMKIGETNPSVEVVFPEVAPEPLKGKKSIYTLTVKGIRRRILPDDASFVESAKVASLDELRANMRRDMEKVAIAQDLENRKNQARELLLAKADFAVPPCLVQRQASAYLSDLAQRAQRAGIGSDYIEQNRDKILDDANRVGTAEVRLSYILLAIADAEKIGVTNDDINQALQKLAENSKDVKAEDLLKQLQEKDQVDLYREQLRAERALNLILDEAK